MSQTGCSITVWARCGDSVRMGLGFSRSFTFIFSCPFSNIPRTSLILTGPRGAAPEENLGHPASSIPPHLWMYDSPDCMCMLREARCGARRRSATDAAGSTCRATTGLVARRKEESAILESILRVVRDDRREGDDASARVTPGTPRRDLANEVTRW